MIERVLYVNQTIAMSGAERSLLDLLEGLPGSTTPVVASPKGELYSALEARGVAVEPLPAVDLSFRLHPTRTPAGLAWIPRAAALIRRIAGRHGAQLIHANSTRAGFPCVLARRFGGPAVVVHARDPVPAGAAGRATLAVIEGGSDLVIANSRYVASQYRDRKGKVRVVHNSVDTARFDPGRFDRPQARARLGLGAGPALALIAHFVPWKAHDDAVRMLAKLKPTHPDLRLLLVGSVKFSEPGGRWDNAGFRRDVEELARSLGVADDVIFTGECDDVPELLSAVDVLLVPSVWEPFGRVVVEGMAMGLPVVATDIGGPVEVIRDGVDGITLPPRSPDAWAAAVAELLDNGERRRALGEAARARVIADFGPDRVVSKVLAHYDEVLADRPARRRGA